jgi:hypothetical protein
MYVYLEQIWSTASKWAKWGHSLLQTLSRLATVVTVGRSSFRILRKDLRELVVGCRGVWGSGSIARVGWQAA